jgi:pyridinium-3,5-bisthiocarboxylic acid mononucleotide nickel chelatase
MFLGALIDLGLPIKHLESELKKLKLKNVSISARRGRRGSISGIDFKVILRRGESRIRPRNRAITRIAPTYTSIEKIINKSGLSSNIKTKSIQVFKKLAQAEAKVHRSSYKKIHFHELGDVDSFIDIVGTVIGLEYFNFKKITCSPIPIGFGTSTTAHGDLPIPTPCTAELLKKAPIQSFAIPHELTTPTGAAIIATFANGFGKCPLKKYEHIGYGLGDKNFKERANFLRILA